MIEEAIQALFNKAVEADRNRFYEVNQEPKGVYYNKTKDGSFERVNAQRPWFNHALYDFDSVASRVADRFATDPGCEIWYSTSGVTCLLSTDGRDRGKLSLTPSLPLQTLIAWDKKHAYELMNHKQLWNAFRTVFDGCFKSHPDLKKQISKVDFKKMQAANSEITSGKVSLDRSMMAEASGASQIPEVLTFTVPFFEDAVAPMFCDIRVAFDLDAEEEKFRFYVLPGEISRVTMEAENYLEIRINRALNSAGLADADAETGTLSSKVPVYCGTP